MSKGAFFHHFPTRKDFVRELHARFHAGAAVAVEQAIGSTDAGAIRIISGITAYLDYCLARYEAKAFLFDARAEGDLGSHVAATNRRFASLMEADLEAMGWQTPSETAQLIVAVVAEVALIEKDLGTVSPLHRSSLWVLLRLETTP